MQTETRKCQNCKADFTIEPEDFDFYRKIDVPPPTWCSECRLVRRLAFRNQRALYHRVCDLCGKETFSTYSEEESFPVYCTPCWFSDKWNPFKYGQDYDFSRPFFVQFRELNRRVPRAALWNRQSVGCEYSEGALNCKNCYFSFGGYHAQDCHYCDSPVFSDTVLDSHVPTKSNHCYEIIHCAGANRLLFSSFCEDCLDSSFLFDCRGCSDCMGCFGLRNQKFCIFNEKYTPDEYKEAVQKWDFGSYKSQKEFSEKFGKLYFKTPRKFAFQTNCLETAGNNNDNTKHCFTCFTTIEGVENCKYVFWSGMNLKDSYDVVGGGENSNLLYEMNGGINDEKALFCVRTHNSQDVRYCDTCLHGSNLFGCVGLRSKKYCIFNKQYGKDEYMELSEKIKAHMHEMPYKDGAGRVYKYGDFFPFEVSPFKYNETWAHQYFPIEAKEAQEKKYGWRTYSRTLHQPTLLSADIPDHIKDIPDSVVGEVIECEHKLECNDQCSGAFRIIPVELAFYRKMHLAIPRLCPNCRHYERLRKLTPLRLWHRRCMCDYKAYKDTKQHNHHPRGRCPNEFETSYSPDRKEIVYCEQCYQAEVV